MDKLELLKQRLKTLDDIPESEAKFIKKPEDLDMYLLCKQKGNMSAWEKIKMFRAISR